ncbi:hypothetical protein OCU04_011250 [Sclerotinia nivalis]|uniref:Uncharacterized protein n=1 Tax=Sclerotinia nivalis TaxID=352851 RepID=A0A9X0DEJ4_9HELO|nr:hypothetical protein OCU04_011250 [Sclerotinia nivalis]
MPIHANFGPFPLPNDHPATPYPAEEGMQWLGYLAPDPEFPIPMDTQAYYLNPYDINGPRGAPPHYPPLAPPAGGFPPPVIPLLLLYQQPARPTSPPPCLRRLPPHEHRFAPPPLTGYLTGSLSGLQNSTLNAGTGINDPPIANPMAELEVQGYFDENNLVAVENQRVLQHLNAIPHPPELTEEYCEGIRREIERLRPVWEGELEAGVPLSRLGVIEGGGEVGSAGDGAGADNEGIEDENVEEGDEDDDDDDMDYDN